MCRPTIDEQLATSQEMCPQPAMLQEMRTEHQLALQPFERSIGGRPARGVGPAGLAQTQARRPPVRAERYLNGLASLNSRMAMRRVSRILGPAGISAA